MKNMDNELSDSVLRALYADTLEILGKEKAEEFKREMNEVFEKKGYEKINWNDSKDK
jgi:hypothetical protein